MKLLDFATVKTGDAHFPHTFDTRGCVVDAYLTDCADVVGALNTTNAPAGGLADSQREEVDTYMVEAKLDRPVTCALPDDEAYLRGVMDNVAARGAALLLKNRAATATSAAGVVAARQAVANETFDPVALHVGIAELVALEDTGVIRHEKGEPVTVWGDPVVLHEIPDFPTMFTGPITLNLSSVETYDDNITTGNIVANFASRYMTLETASCSVIAVGTAP